MGYVDPNAMGIVAQIGYVIVFAITSAFLFFFKPIKKFVARLFNRRSSADAAQAENHSAISSNSSPHSSQAED